MPAWTAPMIAKFENRSSGSEPGSAEAMSCATSVRSSEREGRG
jgi:hypothetical protein